MVVEPEPTERPKAPMRRSFRLHLIPATFLFLMGFIGIVNGVGMPLFALFVNLRYGWVVPHSETPTPNGVALTLANLTSWQLTFWCGVVATVSAFAWLRGRWHLAWGTTALAWLLGGLQSAFFPPH